MGIRGGAIDRRAYSSETKKKKRRSRTKKRASARAKKVSGKKPAGTIWGIDTRRGKASSVQLRLGATRASRGKKSKRKKNSEAAQGTLNEQGPNMQEKN